ncbi:MAG: DNA polymerase III subunit delta' [Myxococcota bacterium]|nr:DNA polymerase III subunit delta' [Myxococcota bacterium]
MNDIQGQDGAIEILRRAVGTQKVAHAYLFSGPAGVGKSMTAQALAMVLNCRDKGSDACGECIDCRKILKRMHPDVIEVSLPDNKARIPIDAVRSLGRQLKTRPHEGRARVAIIDPADFMTEPAANALLKPLEEPSPGNFLILISDRAHALLATVRSRCQVVRFRPLPEAVVTDLLCDSGLQPREAGVVAAFSNGSMAQAQLYARSDLDDRVEQVLTFLETGVRPTPDQGLQVASSLKKNRADAVALLDMMSVILAEILWIQTHGKATRDRPLVEKLGPRLGDLASMLTSLHISKMVAAAHRTARSIQVNNMSPQLAFEAMLMDIRGRADASAAGSGFGA